ncbi:condensation domain-containing protein, partial [Mycolicibacterium hassiacum]|uniref:condensation domain-containing protein n=1 Tax=Mycolicibacterium hassiacum TaxID=46351 RepID=UPI003A599D00
MWLAEVDGPTEQFNQAVVLTAPEGVAEADVVVLLQALLDHHPMLRLRAERGGGGGWVLSVPEPGSVDAAGCVLTVDVLSADAVRAARAKLDPAAGVVLSALWVVSQRRLVVIVHHLAVDAVSWRILVEDLNIAWAQRVRGQSIVLASVGTSFARWAALLAEQATAESVVGFADAWKQITAASAILPSPDPRADTYATAGQLAVELDTDITEQLLTRVPAAFHTGVHEVLLIALAIACAEFIGNGAVPIGIDVETHGRDSDLGVDVDLSRTVGWFTTKHPVALAIHRPAWQKITTGDPDLAALFKHAKEQLRTQPPAHTYGLLRYLNPTTDLPHTQPPIAYNYLGR